MEFPNYSYIKANPELYWQDEEISDLSRADMEALIKEELGEDYKLPGGTKVLMTRIIPKQSKGGILFTEQSRADMSISTQVAKVIGFGPEAFREKARFLTGPRCRIGEFVMFSKYQADSYEFKDFTLYLIEDDRILKEENKPEDIDTSRSVGRL